MSAELERRLVQRVAELVGAEGLFQSSDVPVALAQTLDAVAGRKDERHAPAAQHVGDREGLRISEIDVENGRVDGLLSGASSPSSSRMAGPTGWWPRSVSMSLIIKAMNASSSTTNTRNGAFSVIGRAHRATRRDRGASRVQTRPSGR